MKKIGLVFLSLIIAVVVLSSCKQSNPPKKLSTKDRLVGEYDSDLGTWEFDEDGNVYFSSLEGGWFLRDEEGYMVFDDDSTLKDSTDDDSTDDESTDDESTDDDSPRILEVSFNGYKKDKGSYSIHFKSEIKRDNHESYKKFSKLNLEIEKSDFEGNTSLEEKFGGVDVVRLTRKK